MANYFRMGESVVWLNGEFTGGVQVEDRIWDKPPLPFDYAFDVTAITWDIFAKDRGDLEEFLWHGSLFWEFGAVPRVPIAPLSLFDGSFLDLFHTGEKETELEKLARAVPEAEWMDMARTFLLGQGTLYRGLKRYGKHHVALPPSAEYKIHLTMDGAQVVPKERIRVRVNLIGAFKSVIEVG